MKNLKFLVVSILAVSLVMVSCNKTVEESVMLAEYLESADSPIDVAGIAAYTTAEAVQGMVATQSAYIIDVRSQGDYDTLGHIAGAVNVPLGEVVTHLEGVDLSGYEKVVIACYTGQSAAWVTSLARLAGFDAYSMKWGMSSWNEACTGSLNKNSKNDYATQFVTTETAKAEAGDYPVLTTGLETAEEVLDAQITAVLAEGFGAAAVSSTEVFGALDNYYIVNYWSPAHYALGHIPGAIQYTPNESLLTTADLSTLPTDKTIAVYCYTGQTSAFVAAYLRVLGYDAKSLKFGVNGMAHDWADGEGLTTWGENHIKGYDLVKTGE